MSGIAGILELDGRPVDKDVLRRLSSRTFDLGNDRHGIWEAGSVGLIHALMSVTPEDVNENQPISRGPITVAANTRLDNRPDLIRELRLEPSDWRDAPDSALLLEAYVRWGSDTPRHLLGDFAFALWDDRSGRLVCACDPLGNHPVFFHHNPHRFAFASLAADLRAVPDVSGEMDAAVLAGMLADAPRLPGQTLFKSVSRLPPGHVLEVSRRGLNIRRFWSLHDLPSIELPGDEAYVEAFQEIFDAAVACRLRSAHPVASLLSGGLDSSYVAASASRTLGAVGATLRTYTAVPTRGVLLRQRSGTISDEGPLVEATAKRCTNIVPRFVSTDGRSALKDLEHAFRVAGPPRNVFNYGWDRAIADQSRRDGMRVMLGGAAGNYAMSRTGLERLAGLAIAKDWGVLMDELRCIRRKSGLPLSKLLLRGVVEPLLRRRFPVFRSWSDSRQAAARLRHSAIHPALARDRHLIEQFGTLAEERFDRVKFSRPATQFAEGLLEHDGGNYISLWKYPYQMSARDPTRDVRVVSFALGIPDDQFLAKGEDRLLARRAMADQLPAAVVWNHRHGNQAADWMYRFEETKDDFRRAIDEFRGSSVVREFLDVDRLARLLGRWDSVEKYTRRAASTYRDLFARAIAVGLFVRWHERAA